MWAVSHWWFSIPTCTIPVLRCCNFPRSSQRQWESLEAQQDGDKLGLWWPQLP